METAVAIALDLQGVVVEGANKEVQSGFEFVHPDECSSGKTVVAVVRSGLIAAFREP